MFFKPFGLQGHRQCPHKPPSCCNTHVIIQICVLINHIYQFTNTHTYINKSIKTPFYEPFHSTRTNCGTTHFLACSHRGN